MKPARSVRLSPLGMALILLLTLNPMQIAQSSEKHSLTKQQVEEMLSSLSNWGRWGKDDQRGALNLITPEKKAQAAKLVTAGKSISLAHDAVKTRQDDSPPFEHRMIETGVDGKSQSAADIYSVQYHGFSVTHLDALCHVFHQGKMYNGFSQREVTEQGAAKLSVLAAKDGIVGRGVLIDFPKMWNLPFLPGNRAIYPEDLDAWEKYSGVKIEAGDIIFIRTGRWARREAEEPWEIMQNSAGLHSSCLPWLKERDVAVVGSDLATDVMPSQVDGIVLPVHLVLIVGMGVHILDNCDLEALSRFAGEHKRYAFLVTAAPLPVGGGTGSPINPIAIF